MKEAVALNSFESVPTYEEFEFSTITVTGRIKLTDELIKRRVVVTSTPSGVEVSEGELQVRFTPSAAMIQRFMPGPLSLEDAIRETVVWAKPGGAGETYTTNEANAKVNADGSFTALLLRSEYAVSLLLPMATEGRLTHTRTIASGIATVTPPDDETRPVDLGELEVHIRDESDPRRVPGAVNTVRDADMFNSFDRARSLPPQRPSSVPQFQGALPWDDRPPRRQDDRSIVDPLPGPARSVTSTPVDQSIARLVTDLLAAGDRRTRENMRPPLQKLLEQKLDAEQQAREALVEQLNARLKEASKQVAERKQDRDRIVLDQLERMMSLPEDSFLPMSNVLNPNGRSDSE